MVRSSGFRQGPRSFYFLNLCPINSEKSNKLLASITEGCNFD
jgi:hypothetical protein